MTEEVNKNRNIYHLTDFKKNDSEIAYEHYIRNPHFYLPNETICQVTDDGEYYSVVKDDGNDTVIVEGVPLDPMMYAILVSSIRLEQKILQLLEKYEPGSIDWDRPPSQSVTLIKL